MITVQREKEIEKRLISITKELIDIANELEEQVDIVTKNMEDMHIERLSQGICTPTVGAQYLSFSTNAERIADHLINVGKTARVMTNRR